jgi:hypothetical protein
VSSFRQATTLYRQAGSYVDGVWVDSGESQIAITASIQPATGKDLQNLEQGRRNSAVYAVYTDTALLTTEQAVGATPGTKADQLEIGGIRHEAVHVEPWQNNVINHYRALFARIK